MSFSSKGAAQPLTSSAMYRPLLILGASLPLVTGFVGTGPAIRPAGVRTGPASGICAIKSVERREMVGKVATLGAALVFGATPAFAKGIMAVSLCGQLS